MQHRIFLVPTRADLAPEAARRHWEDRHGDIFIHTPGLLRYRQNRPVDAEWARGTARFCSETWYADRDTERSAYTSTYYREVVTPDEAAFLTREAAWSAVVIGYQSVLSIQDGPRVLWFDATPPMGPEWDELKLDRQVPPPGGGTSVHVATLDDLDAALELTGGAEPVALVCHSVSTVPVPNTEEAE